MSHTVTKGVANLVTSVLMNKFTVSKVKMEEPHSVKKYAGSMRWQEWNDRFFPVSVQPIMYNGKAVLSFTVHSGDLDPDDKFDESVLMKSVQFWANGEAPTVSWERRRGSPQDLLLSFGRTGILILFKKLQDNTDHYLMMMKDE